MAAHNFNFEGGDILTGMGASWFVSYAYYEKIDRTHRNWIELQLHNLVFPNITKEENITSIGLKRFLQ